MSGVWGCRSRATDGQAARGRCGGRRAGQMLGCPGSARPEMDATLLRAPARLSKPASPPPRHLLAPGKFQGMKRPMLSQTDRESPIRGGGGRRMASCGVLANRQRSTGCDVGRMMQPQLRAGPRPQGPVQRPPGPPTTASKGRSCPELGFLNNSTVRAPCPEPLHQG